MSLHAENKFLIPHKTQSFQTVMTKSGILTTLIYALTLKISKTLELKVNEAEMSLVFFLPVDATSLNTISVTLCSSHRLKYFNDKRFNCSLCQKRFVRGMYKKRISENMLDFAKTFIATIPGNMPDESKTFVFIICHVVVALMH